MKKFKSFIKEENLKDFEEDCLAGKKPVKQPTEETEKKETKEDENI